MPKTADRVLETTTTTGTGTITLAGATTGYRTFQSAFTVGDRIQFVIEDTATGAWEVVEGALATTTTLTRDNVVASSNSGALVSFAAGTKNVFATAHAIALNAGRHGRTLAIARGIPRP